MKHRSKILLSAIVSTLLLVGSTAVADKDDSHTKTPFRINIAEWSDEVEVLRVQGKCQYNCVIEVFNEGSGELIAITEEVPGKTWYVTIPEKGSDPPLDPVPCVVGAHQIGSDTCRDAYDTLDVQNAPDDCAPVLEERYLFGY
jgi:hypothetical protein